VVHSFHKIRARRILAHARIPIIDDHFSKLLGHRKTAMTLRYTYVADKDITAAAKRIGRVLNDLLR
jgi:hypothetical protein